MSATAANIRTATGGGNLRRIRPVETYKIPVLRLGRFFAILATFLAFMGMSALFFAVPNKPETVVALAVGLVIALCIIRWPIVGTFCCLILAITFDSLPSPWMHTIVGDLGVFRNLSYKGLPQFVWLSMFEVVAVLTFASALVRRFHAHQKMVRGNIFFGMMAYGAMVLFGEMNGLLTGGDFKISLWELRPLGYVVVLYILAVNTISKPRDFRWLLWITILSIAARCLEAVTRYFTMSADVRAIASVILEHDDSMLLVAVITLLVPVLLWRKYLPKRLLWMLIALTPLAFYVIVINHRRAAYFCLILSLLAMVPVIWISLRTRKARMRLVKILAIIAVVAPIYVLVFWNTSNVLGEPAQAVRSVIAPDERDYLSNLYRIQEDTNLHATIGLSPLMGIGFGKPMMVVTPMVDLTDQWALQLYMPHDNMLWIWMRVGMIGFAVFWMTVGSVLILVVGSIRIGVRRLDYLISLEEKPDPAEERRERGLTGDVPGLRVVHIKPSKDDAIVGHTRDMALEKAHREELQEAAEFLVLAFLALASFVSMLTLAVVDQGLMSPRLSSYWGLMLGALTVGWEIKRLDFLRPGVRDKTVTAELPGARGKGKKELERDKGHRVRVITGPSNAA